MKIPVARKAFPMDVLVSAWRKLTFLEVVWRTGGLVVIYIVAFESWNGRNSPFSVDSYSLKAIVRIMETEFVDELKKFAWLNTILVLNYSFNFF